MILGTGADVFGDISTAASGYLTAGWALLGVVLGGVIGMKLLKKIASRAS